MTSLGTSKGILEIAKFAVYVTVPIGLMFFFANNTGNLKKFMGNERFMGSVKIAPPARIIVADDPFDSDHEGGGIATSGLPKIFIYLVWEIHKNHCRDKVHAYKVEHA